MSRMTKIACALAMAMFTSLSYGEEYVFELNESAQFGKIQEPTISQGHVRALVKVESTDMTTKFIFSNIVLENKGDLPDEIFARFKPEMAEGLTIVFDYKGKKPLQLFLSGEKVFEAANLLEINEYFRRPDATIEGMTKAYLAWLFIRNVPLFPKDKLMMLKVNGGIDSVFGNSVRENNLNSGDIWHGFICKNIYKNGDNTAFILSSVIKRTSTDLWKATDSPDMIEREKKDGVINYLNWKAEAEIAERDVFPYYFKGEVEFMYKSNKEANISSNKASVSFESKSRSPLENPNTK